MLGRGGGSRCVGGWGVGLREYAGGVCVCVWGGGVRECTGGGGGNEGMYWGLGSVLERGKFEGVLGELRECVGWGYGSV